MSRRRRFSSLVALLATGALLMLPACEGGGVGGSGDPLSLIGKSFEDPAVSDLARRLCNGFPNDNIGNIKCLGQGFELNLRSDLSVGSVTLYNAESGGFSQYRGTLPYNLTWDDRFPDVVNKLGSPDAQYGGSGVDVWLDYQQLGAHQIEVHFYARHNNPEDLVNSGIHYVHVSS